MYQQHIIIDLEMNPVSTNEHEARKHIGREVIEIGAIKLDESLKIIDRFQCYVKPQYNEHICGFIRRLTGIGFSQTHDANSFSEAMNLLATWIGDKKTRIYSWSDSDLIQLRKECLFKDVPFPTNMSRWTDLQAIFPRMMQQNSYRKLSLKNAATVFGIALDQERAHGALYDAEITAELLIPFLDGSYRARAAYQHTMILTEPSYSTTTLGQACGGILQQLLAKMRAEQQPAPVCLAN